MRRLIGMIIEWFLCYEHKVVVNSDKAYNLPFRKFKGDAGYDLYCNEDIMIQPKQTCMIPSGLFIDPRDQIWFEMQGRSSTFKKIGIQIIDAVLDRDFRGELFAVAYNPNDVYVKINKGDRLVQIIPHRLIPCKFVRGKLSKSERGNSGFGSTGK